MSENEAGAPGAGTPLIAPTGGVKLPEGRWTVLAPQWATIDGQIRTLDAAELGETEPSVLFGLGGNNR